MKQKIFKMHPISAFHYVCVIILILALIIRYIPHQYAILIVIMAIVFFGIYTIIVFRNYTRVYTKRKALIFLSIDNGIMFLGLVYMFSVEYFVYRGTGIINFIYILSLVIFLIPSIIRNVLIVNKSRSIENHTTKDN